MGLGLALLGVAIGLLPLGLEAIGFQLSARQGYVILVVAALFVLAAVLVFFWPWIAEAWKWVRRDAELDEVREEQEQLKERLREIGEERDALQARVIALEGQQNPRQPSELKGLCLHISQDMSDFVNRRLTSDPGFDIFQERKNAKNKDELDEITHRENEARRHHEEETLRLYHKRYKNRVMGIYRELAPQYWFGVDDREYFENPADTDEIKTVA